MGKLIGGVKITEGALAQMRERGGTWAVYQNHAMDSSDLGGLRFLKVGPGCTYEKAPGKYPDTREYGIGWRHVFVGMLDLETGAVVEGGD